VRNLIYPVFGLIVLGSYGWVMMRGIDPGSVAAETRALPPEARTAGQGGSGLRAGPGFWFVGGSYGGGK
jgi:hypothetical protein